jgi:hypothetical protein
MTIAFSRLPGRHERHYRRRIGNPLFPDGPEGPEADSLLEAQRLDHEELVGFLTQLRHTVRRAVDLRPNEGSEVILEIKETLDRLYETSAGLAEDHDGNQAAIRQLLDVIMRNVERGASDDPQALEELAQERIARDAHFALLRSPLVADLLHPQSAITAGDLVPSLLSAGEQDLDAALQLFDREQLGRLYSDAQQYLAGLGEPPATGVAGLEQIAAHLARLNQQMGIN